MKGSFKDALSLPLPSPADLLAALVESANDAIISKTLDGIVTSWNSAAERIFGFTAPEILGKPIHTIIPKELASEEENILSAIRRGERIEHYETVRLRKDGSLVEVSLTVSPILTPNGEIVGASKIAHDITERRKTERAVLRSQAELKDFIENVSLGMHWVDSNGIITWANRAELQMLGYEASEYIGRPISDFYFDRDAAAEISENLRTGEPIRNREVMLRHKDGSARYGLLNSTVLKEDGKFIHSRCFMRDVTQSRRAEEELRRSADLLRASRDTFYQLVHNSPFGVYVVDADFRLIEVSAGAQKVFQNIKPLIGRDFAEILRCIWVEPFASEAISLFRRTLETGAPYHAPNTIELRSDISAVESYDWKIERIALPDGRYGVVCHFYDLSEHNRYEEALRSSKKLIEDVLNSISAHICVLDRNGTITLVNDAWRRFAADNCSADGPEGLLAGANYLRACASATQDDLSEASFVRQGVKDILEGRRLEFSVEYPCHSPTEQRWFLLSASPLSGESGAVIVHQNITERKLAERGIRRANKRFELVAKATNDAVWDWVIDKNEVWWNDGVYKLFGYHAKEVGGPNWWQERLHPEDHDRVVAGMQSAIYGRGENWSEEYRFLRADGEYAAVLDRGYIIRDKSGKATRMVGAMLDITERERIETERHRVLERELQARREAEAANQAKDEFLAVLSHELRTPLNAIKGWLRLIDHEQLDKPTREHAFDVIKRNVDAQQALIEDILDVSRIISGKLAIEKHQLPLVSVINESIEETRPAAANAGLIVSTVIEPDTDLIEGDAGRLKQVVNNLLINAIKFTPAGGKITVSLKREAGSARVTVSDTGVGIDPALLPFIFDRFRQADSSSKRRHGGLGLGLAITKHIVELHGGSITAASDGEGKGAQFSFLLPLYKAETASAATGTSMTALADRGHPAAEPLNGLAVLIVEDDPDSLQMLTLMLQHAGASVTGVRVAAEAVSSLGQSRFDLLLSDLGLPDMDGYQLIRTVREELKLSKDELPAIALSGYVGVEDRARSLKTGFQRHLPKPVDLDALTRSIISLAINNEHKASH